MDKGAIWEASETDLNQLGLTERGDIIRLKAFAVEKSENKKNLLNTLQMQEKSALPAKKLQRKSSDIRVGSLS